MKKTLFRCFVMVMVLLLLSTTAFADKDERFGLDIYKDVSFDTSADAYPEQKADLYAGKSIYIGEVRIESLGDNVYRVTYFIPADSDWNFAEIHFEGISKNEMTFISNNGGLIPGKFSAKMSFDPLVEVKLVSFTYEGTLPIESFAAHAVVFMIGELGCVVQEETAWAGCLDTDGSNWSKYFPSNFLISE